MKEKLDFYSTEVIKTYNLSPEIRYQLKILDSLDPFTRKHSEGVAEMTNKLCKEMNMSEGFTIYCTICAYVHDIGKIFIPPKVLQKTGKLTEEEYEIMKSHTTIGYNICHSDLKLRPYEAGPLYHHEALDGTGYPNGLIGNEILIEGQIIRVADEYDAITNKRQYKEQISRVDTLKILIENTKPTKFSKGRNGLFGKRYGKNNPKVVRALVKIVKEEVEQEIYEKILNVNNLENEIKRYELAKKMYDKYITAKTNDRIEYFKAYTKGYLTRTEEVENTPIYLEDSKKTYDLRKEELEKLKEEFKEIKKLRV